MNAKLEVRDFPSISEGYDLKWINLHQKLHINSEWVYLK